MHQSPLKELGGPRREKYAAFFPVSEDDDADERRLQRGSQPKARKFHLRQEAPRGERARQHPKG
ncbi:hypothetical protein [Ramlibacter humi]|uniref:Uncharacterized protein n=1 Tax=Ramlibacter humi TaxID=2530451 RepID=A0A4Z0BLQ1_9BURK|nr:hypothetical protein [Ramlibacter humi]TFZ00256.1 hypothetical protein EZ216_14245 [Ramlibacter humi]